MFEFNRATLLSVPFEIFQHHIISHLSIPSLISFSSTSATFRKPYIRYSSPTKTLIAKNKLSFSKTTRHRPCELVSRGRDILIFIALVPKLSQLSAHFDEFSNSLPRTIYLSFAAEEYCPENCIYIICAGGHLSILKHASLASIRDMKVICAPVPRSEASCRR